jgi:transcriptional regulator with XRE-family HTH domain
MTPDELRQARLKLGLSLSQLAEMLGYRGDREQLRSMGYELESGRKAIREPQRRLVEAYLAGYRPPEGWPA